MRRKRNFNGQTFSFPKLWQSLQHWDPRKPKAPIPSIQIGQGDRTDHAQTDRTSVLVTWQDLRTLPAKTLYKSKEVLTQRVPKLVLHNPVAPKGMPKRKTYPLVADQSGDCYYPIGRDINTLRQTGGNDNALIEVSGSPTISRHHCTIYKPNSELSFTERAQNNCWKALRRYLSRTIQGEDYLLSDTRGNCNGVFLKNSLWQRLRTGKQATRMEQDTPLRHRDVLFLTKPNAKGVDGKTIKPVTIRFIYPAIWYVREFWGIVRLLLLGSGIVVGSSWFAIATVRTVKLDPLPPIPAPLAIFASNGVTQISGGIATPHQDIATLDEFPPLLLKTLLLSEDKWYYSHPGVNPVSIVNATIANRLSGETLSGASTITMQLARTLFLEEVNNKSLWGEDLEAVDEAGNPLNPDTLKLTLTRKIREAGLALRLNANYSKDELLLAYLNSVDLGYRDLTGQQLRGIADASTFYFNQPIANLTLTGDGQDVMKVARIANLIALIKAPRVAYGVCESRLSSDAVDAWLRSQEEQDIPLQEPNPKTYVNPVELARDEVVYLMRLRNGLIQKMKARGWISAAVAELAQDMSNFIVFENRAGFCERQVPEGDRFEASPIFLSQSIREELQQILPPHFEAPHENLIIETSLDIEKQTIATQLLKQHKEELWRTQGVPHGALLTIDSRTGRIQALVGEVTFPGTNDQEWVADFSANEYLPPGSTFKMFFYVDALKAGMPLSQTYSCDTLSLGGEVFTAAAYSKLCNGGMGTIDLETAVSRSDNLVPLKVVNQYSSLESVAETAKLMGIQSPLDPPVPRMAFGYHRVNLREITAAYGVLANGGYYNPPHFITAVYKNTNTGGCSSSPEDYRNCPLIYNDAEVRSNHTVIPKAVTEDMTQLLRSVVSPLGTGAMASLAPDAETPSPFQEAGKTGTSDRYQDGWFIGYLPGGLVTTVWFGNFVQPQIAQPEQKVYATSTNAAQAWGEYMRHCYEEWICTANPPAQSIAPAPSKP